MNRQSQQDIFLKNKNLYKFEKTMRKTHQCRGEWSFAPIKSLLLKEKIQDKNKKQNWMRERNRNKFAYLKITAIFLSVFLTILLSAWLTIEQSVASNLLEQKVKEESTLVRQKSLQEETSSEESSQEEATLEQSPKEETRLEESSQEETKPEQELSLEEVKKSLEEEIHERYEEWESQRTGSEISHSISAIATIIMTVFIALLGTGLVALPHKRLIIILLAILTVIIQLNNNIFLLEKSLGGYQILEEQGLILKNKLKTASTDEELTEVREQFQELVIESINLEY
jgi:heme/copper-type cytochrome/quinol oxidase subunit 4